MPHTIPPFPAVTCNGFIWLPGNLPRSWAVQIKPIHNQLRADVSHHPEQEEQLVCRAFQQLYDVYWGFYRAGRAAYNAAFEAELGEKVFRIAQECRWLPEGALRGNPAWRGWVHQLIAGRYKWEGFEDYSQPDPYLFVPFPKERGGAEVLGILAPAEDTTVAAANATGAKRRNPGPQTDFENARRVAEIVERVAQGENWTTRLDDICEALDEKEEKIPCPKPWRKLTPPISDWSDAAACDRGRARKAIAHHLKNARAS